MGGGEIRSIASIPIMSRFDHRTHTRTHHLRAQRLETLDEVEEWRMLMGHYCYVTATRGAALLGSLLRDVEGFQECQGT